MGRVETSTLKSKKPGFGAGQMTQWVKALANNHDDLTAISEPLTLEKGSMAPELESSM